MNSGLYAFAGASATATAAACAKRLLDADDEGLEGVLRVQPGRLEVTSSAHFATGAELGVGRFMRPGWHVAFVAKVADVGGVVGGAGLVASRRGVVEIGGWFGRRLSGRLDGDRHPGLATELGGEGGGQSRTKPGLQHILGEIVRSGEQHRVFDDGERTDQRDPGLELGGQLALVGQPTGGALPQFGEVGAVTTRGVLRGRHATPLSLVHTVVHNLCTQRGGNRRVRDVSLQTSGRGTLTAARPALQGVLHKRPPTRRI